MRGTRCFHRMHMSDEKSIRVINVDRLKNFRPSVGRDLRALWCQNTRTIRPTQLHKFDVLNFVVTSLPVSWRVKHLKLDAVCTLTKFCSSCGSTFHSEGQGPGARRRRARAAVAFKKL